MKVRLPVRLLQAVSQDAADSFVACVTMAAAVHLYGINDRWDAKPSFASEAEWNRQKTEGLIVRI
ncbi:hypothetical protein [Effusibacillus dendaii]|uniref:hypothetical protein n=1 Tax=Effusibacillus dendaii TaxID=2743772 RepID=UPI00190CA18B|nr:hypothetical protein [Effusibacillus dendaii]